MGTSMVRGVGAGFRGVMVVASLVAIGVSCGKSEKSTKDKDGAAAPSDPSSGTTDGTVSTLPGTYQLTWVEPDADEVVSEGLINIKVAFKDVAPTATWNLYYSTVSGSLEGAIAIAKDVPVTTTTYAWETSFAEGGTFFLYATLKNGSVVTLHQARTRITINSASDGRTPYVVLTQPNQQNIVYKRGEQVNVAFSSIHPDGTDMTVTVQYSVNGTDGWVNIDEVTPDTTSLQWTVPNDAPRSANYKFRVVAKDTAGREGSATSTSRFGVADDEINYNEHIQPIVTAKCTGCHTGDADGQNNHRPDLYADSLHSDGTTTLTGANSRHDTIRNRTQPGAQNPMPPGGGLTAAEQDLFWLWANYEVDRNDGDNDPLEADPTP